MGAILLTNCSRVHRGTVGPRPRPSGHDASRLRVSAQDASRKRLWTPPWMQAFSSNGSVHVVRCSRLSGLLMRQDIRRWPVWRYADRVQNRPRGLQRAMSGHWFSRSRLVDRLPLHALRPAHIPDDFRPTSTSSGRRQLRRGSSPFSSLPPRRCAPFGWPVRRQQPSSACAPASGPAMSPPARRDEPPVG